MNATNTYGDEDYNSSQTTEAAATADDQIDLDGFEEAARETYYNKNKDWYHEEFADELQEDFVTAVKDNESAAAAFDDAGHKYVLVEIEETGQKFISGMWGDYHSDKRDQLYDTLRKTDDEFDPEEYTIEIGGGSFKLSSGSEDEDADYIIDKSSYSNDFGRPEGGHEAAAEVLENLGYDVTIE